MQMAPSMPREFSCRLWEAAGSEHRPPARSGGVLPGVQGTHLSLRRLRFTFSALAIALAPATPMEFPLKLQRKADHGEGQPGVTRGPRALRGREEEVGEGAPHEQAKGQVSLLGRDVGDARGDETKTGASDTPRERCHRAGDSLAPPSTYSRICRLLLTIKASARAWAPAAPTEAT